MALQLGGKSWIGGPSTRTCVSGRAGSTFRISFHKFLELWGNCVGANAQASTQTMRFDTGLLRKEQGSSTHLLKSAFWVGGHTHNKELHECLRWYRQVNRKRSTFSTLFCKYMRATLGPWSPSAIMELLFNDLVFWKDTLPLHISLGELFLHEFNDHR